MNHKANWKKNKLCTVMPKHDIFSIPNVKNDLFPCHARPHIVGCSSSTALKASVPFVGCH